MKQVLISVFLLACMVFTGMHAEAHGKGKKKGHYKHKHYKSHYYKKHHRHYGGADYYGRRAYRYSRRPAVMEPHRPVIIVPPRPPHPPLPRYR